MKVRDFAQKMGMEIYTGEIGLENEINSMYACDLLSWVISNAGKSKAWITIHTHINVVAVALMVEVPCVIIPEGIQIEKATINKALEEGIVILGTKMSGYEICWKAHELLEKN